MRITRGNVAAITGAGPGIGRSLAVQLVRRGCVVALADINGDALRETGKLIEDLGGVCSLHVVDVSDRAAVEAFATEVVRLHGGVQLLFNNAGVAPVDKIETHSYEDFEWMMNINFWGVVYGTKAFLPYLHRAEQAHIVNVSSLFGLMSLPSQAAYCSAKYAVRGFTESLKMELSASSIGVSCAHPGGIRTGIAKNSRVRDENLSVSKEQLSASFEKAARTTADQAAAKLIRGVEKNKRRILIGCDARLSDWISRLFPGSYEKRLGLEKAVKRNAQISKTSTTEKPA